MSDFPSAPPPTGMMGATPATFVQRLIAIIIDYGLILLMLIPAIILAFIVGKISGVLGFLVGMLLYLVIFLAAMYMYIGGIAATGQTPGKRMQGIQVVNDSGGVLGLGGAVIRYIVAGIFNAVVCGIPVGALWMLFDPEKKTLYDKVLNNQVIQVPSGDLLPIFPNGNPI